MSNIEEIIKTEVELHKQFKNVNVIGFDMDMAIVRYNNETTALVIYECVLDHLVTVFPFLKESKLDFSFSKRGLVIDLELGLILKLDNKKRVIKAFRGKSIVSKEEIDSIYHDEMVIGSPLKDYNGSNSARFFTMISFFETPITSIIRDFMEYQISESIRLDKPIDYSLFKQLVKEIYISFGKHFNDFYTGHYYTSFRKDPSKYIYKASDRLKNWLMEIRSPKHNTKVLLITNSKSEYCHSVLEFSFGKNFRDYFDCIIVDAKKPDFFSSDINSKPFTKLMSFHPKEKSDYIPCSNIELNVTHDTVFKGGNIHLVLNKLKEHFQKDQISFCYVGDNIIGDVVAPKQVKLMTVAIIEEIQDPDEIIILKREKNTKNQDVQVNSEGLVERSTGEANYVWGSFFHIHDDHQNISIDTFWSGILRDNADIVVYGVDTLVEYYYQDKFDNQDTLAPCAVVYSQ
ncbi:hypothetical protein RB653_008167 [Dictyostelium firmibasis]|uniref:5'-nucleotidase n=1 Tax=Dictyostelium firmibasis TaxID=79012 RepID=A0AAN7YTT2_9MYCE